MVQSKRKNRLQNVNAYRLHPTYRRRQASVKINRAAEVCSDSDGEAELSDDFIPTRYGEGTTWTKVVLDVDDEKR